MQPFLAYFCIPFFFCILLFNGFWVWIPKFEGVQFVMSYLTFPYTVIPYILYKLWWRTRVVDLRQVNFGSCARGLLHADNKEGSGSGDNDVDPAMVVDAGVINEKKNKTKVTTKRVPVPSVDGSTPTTTTASSPSASSPSESA